MSVYVLVYEYKSFLTLMYFGVLLVNEASLLQCFIETTKFDLFLS